VGGRISSRFVAAKNVSVPIGKDRLFRNEGGTSGENPKGASRELRKKLATFRDCVSVEKACAAQHP